jgi:hypothetical protein
MLQQHFPKEAPFYDDDTIHRSAIGVSEDQNTKQGALPSASAMPIE